MTIIVVCSRSEMAKRGSIFRAWCPLDQGWPRESLFSEHGAYSRSGVGKREPIFRAWCVV